MGRELTCKWQNSWSERDLIHMYVKPCGSYTVKSMYVRVRVFKYACLHALLSAFICLCHYSSLYIYFYLFRFAYLHLQSSWISLWSKKWKNRPIWLKRLSHTAGKSCYFQCNCALASLLKKLLTFKYNNTMLIALSSSSVPELIT